MTSVDRDRLLALVNTTFASIPKPECTKRIARALDDEWLLSEPRFAELRALDKEENWQDLQPDEIDAFSDILFWISPEGFRFYFPAFLHYSIRYWELSHTRVQQETVEVIGRQKYLVQHLTLTEAAVAAQILEELASDPTGSNYYTEAADSIQILKEHAARQR